MNDSKRSMLSAALMEHSANIGKAGLQLLVAASALIAGTSQAQQVLIEKQVSLLLARDIAMATVEHCRKDGFRVAVTVVDRAGRIKAVLRDDGTGPHAVEASQRKAYTAAAFRVSTAAFAERMSNPAAAPLTQLKDVIALRGGVPIKAGDEVIGAIGVGGAPGGDKDEACAQAGIQKVAEQLQ